MLLFMYLLVAFLWAYYSMVKHKKVNPTKSSVDKMILVFGINLLFTPLAMGFAILKKKF